MDRVLVADDEMWVRELMFEVLKERYTIAQAEDGSQAWEMLHETEFAAVLLDLRMPGMAGMEVLRRMHQQGTPTVPVIITANKDVDSAVQAMKLGAFDYVVKPFDNEKLQILVKNAVEKYNLENRVRNLQDAVRKDYGFDNIIGKSASMQRVFRLLQRVLDNDSTLLITGESGTGKEVIARAVHFNGPRQAMPFIALDCAAIPDTLIENEFFGHEKGAFTGAHNLALGKFELADRGTLFLDEIGNLRLDVQAKLLRVLQEREFTRIGGTEKIRTDVRIICATNSDLEQAMREDRFREDLFYRINVVPISLPPLREREADIPLLIHFFLDRFNQEMGKDVSISASAIQILMDYSWPGNVRELENLLNRLVVLKGSGTIEAADLPAPFRGEDSPLAGQYEAPLTLEELERRYILRVLEQEDNNISRTARALGITRKTLHNKLSRFRNQGD